MIDKNKHVYEIMQKALLFIRDNPGKDFRQIHKHLDTTRDNPQVLPEHQSKTSDELFDLIIRCIEYFTDESLIKINGSWITITIQGILLLNRGGFVQQYELEKNEFKNKLKGSNSQYHINKIVAVTGLLSVVIALITTIKNC